MANEKFWLSAEQGSNHHHRHHHHHYCYHYYYHYNYHYDYYCYYHRQRHCHCYCLVTFFHLCLTSILGRVTMLCLRAVTSGCGFLSILLSTGLYLSPLCQAQGCTPEACRLPDCTCPSTDPPGNFSRSELPQIVTISFDDSVTAPKAQAYRRLFTADRRNPNGCPIQVHV